MIKNQLLFLHLVFPDFINKIILQSAISFQLVGGTSRRKPRCQKVIGFISKCILQSAISFQLVWGYFLSPPNDKTRCQKVICFISKLTLQSAILFQLGGVRGYFVSPRDEKQGVKSNWFHQRSYLAKCFFTPTCGGCFPSPPPQRKTRCQKVFDFINQVILQSAILFQLVGGFFPSPPDEKQGQKVTDFINEVIVQSAILFQLVGGASRTPPTKNKVSKSICFYEHSYLAKCYFIPTCGGVLPEPP